MERLGRDLVLSGVAVFVIFAVGNALWALDMPDRDASAAELVSFYEDTSVRIIVGAHLSLVSIAIMVWWGALLRDALERMAGPESRGLPLTAFGGVLAAVGAGLVAETVNMGGALRAETDAGVSSETAQACFEVSQALGWTAAGVALAVLTASVALVSLRGRAFLPRWLAIGMLVLAVALLVPSLAVVKAGFAIAFLLLPVISFCLARELRSYG